MASVDTVNASSPSSSSSSNIFYEGGKKYDVFLSFRGNDTRNSLTYHLFAAMHQKGISAFRDDEQYEEGKNLLMAIEESKSSSSWCLTELTKMVECMEKKKLIILPIFHYVDPTDVRNQRGAFADAFAKHEELFKDSPGFVSTWRYALTEVANIPGWVLNYGDQEAQLIDEFIESLSNQMPEDGSPNWNLPPRFDDSPDEADDADDDVGETVQDYAADLPREAHVVPDDVADAPQACPICVTNARNMAFLCGHTTCVECGERLDTCHICREPISRRIRLFLG